MLKVLASNVFWAPEQMNGRHARSYVLLKVGLPLAVFLHSVVFLASYYSDIRPMIVLNFLSIPAYVFGFFYLIVVRRLAIPFWIVQVEMPIHAYVSVLATGLEGGFFLFGLAPSAFAFFAAFLSWNFRVVLTSVNVLLFGIISVTGVLHEQWFELSQVWQFWLMTYSSIGIATTVAVIVGINQWAATRAEDALEAEHARSEALLYNLLPEEIAARLKVEPDSTIADSLPQVAILFADIVNFTPRSASMSPEKIVEFLNRVFSAFDELAEKHQLEKIKTIGDAYMVAAGMPNPCGDPVHRVAEMALDMLEVASGLPDDVEVRIGLHAGPAVAGVIGNKKLFYDVWGETVNTASRMESHGEPGRVQVTEAAWSELSDTYRFQARGTVEVKGMGPVKTWWLVGRKAPQHPRPAL